MKNLKKAALVASEIAGIMALTITNAFAQVQISEPVSTGNITLGGLVNTIVKVVFGVGILLCLVFLVFYGIKYITAGDDVKQIDGARKGITGAVIGLIVILLAFTIVKIVATFFGVNSGDIFNILPTSFQA